MKNIPKDKFSVLAISAFFEKFGGVENVKLDWTKYAAVIIFREVTGAEKAFQAYNEGMTILEGGNI